MKRHQGSRDAVPVSRSSMLRSDGNPKKMALFALLSVAQGAAVVLVVKPSEQSRPMSIPVHGMAGT